MPKVIIYLDQNFVSNMANAKSGTLRDDRWLHLYELLDDLVHNKQKVICPESFFHQIESSQSKELVSNINDVVCQLSWGLRLIRWEVAFRYQVRRAMCMILGKKEPPRSWIQAFSHDPNEPTSNRSLSFMGGKILPYLRWWRPDFPELIEIDKWIKELYPKAIDEIRRAAAERDFASYVEELIWIFIGSHYVAPSQKAKEIFFSGKVPKNLAGCDELFGGSEWSILQEMWRDLGGEKVRLTDFLVSEYFKSCPFLDIQSQLRAALLVDPGRTAKEGDYLDARIIATAMPHCDFLAVDGPMKYLVEQIGLDIKYGVTIFSAKRDSFEIFVELLRGLR